ncbi:MAG: pyruvate dehydrogenase (acetyl-transferring) E1 component subunit alpha [Planctomycetota bacterium]
MPKSTAFEGTIKHFQLLDEQGVLDEKLAAKNPKGHLSDEDALYLYEMMVLCRHYDEVAFKLQRSGRMGTYPQNKGQEAGPAGIGLAIKRHAPGSWLVPCYRENIALFINGLPMEKILLSWMGDERGNQMPDGLNQMPFAVPIGTHPLHATGIAWGLAYKAQRAGRENKQVAVAFIGDGASSEGDVHEALNFAGVLKAPMILVIQNNGWAISVPREKQTASETFAQKAFAYGLHGVRCDGNDIFASYKVMTEAIDRALEDNQPTIIETLTYRLGDHTTADDARRYRDQAELDAWLKKDPMIRTRAYLEAKGMWDQAKQDGAEARAKETVAEIVKNAEGIAEPGVGDMFDYTFDGLPKQLRLQRETMGTSGLEQAPHQERLQQELETSVA